MEREPRAENPDTHAGEPNGCPYQRCPLELLCFSDFRIITYNAKNATSYKRIDGAKAIPPYLDEVPIGKTLKIA